ncbi:MAG: GNAT family N-acetyltransferase [Pseudomonadota bacterium]
MVVFHEVDGHNVRAVCELRVAPGQEGLVSPAAYTLAEAQFEPGAWLRAIYACDRPVGLVAMIDPRAPSDDTEIRTDAAFLWRLMVAEGHQGKGFGSAALSIAAWTARDWGFSRITLTVSPEAGSAQPFYRRHGFELTGRVLFDGTELEMLREL